MPLVGHWTDPKRLEQLHYYLLSRDLKTEKLWNNWCWEDQKKTRLLCGQSINRINNFLPRNNWLVKLLPFQTTKEIWIDDVTYTVTLVIAMWKEFWQNVIKLYILLKVKLTYEKKTFQNPSNDRYLKSTILPRNDDRCHLPVLVFVFIFFSRVGKDLLPLQAIFQMSTTLFRVLLPCKIYINYLYLSLACLIELLFSCLLPPDWDPYLSMYNQGCYIASQ